MKRCVISAALASTMLLGSIRLCAGEVIPHVKLEANKLLVDGKDVPFLYGAEVQYFRARGGATRNIDAEKVYASWEKLLDQVKAAGMNMVTFYIPWDFHEPVEGQFDFDGQTIDQDRDGKPDYPSRNLHKWFELIAKKNIKYVMVRPGPYINAEWGPVGFGAIPHWFLDNPKFQDAWMKNRTENKPKVISFSHPLYREKVNKWFSELYKQVLKDHMGPGKPIIQMQIDNETNFFWDTIYERDVSDRSLGRFQNFLQKKYADLDALNEAYQSPISSFQDIKIPTSFDDKSIAGKAWHYDWFQFHDDEILDYYQFLRSTWESIGVREPDVQFTSCDSYNVIPGIPHMLLPRYDYRQNNQLTFTTMNVYPKTNGPSSLAILNQPMKAAFDAELVGASHEAYYKNGQQWVMATETMGGWFPPTQVTREAREHTYYSLLGSGLKAMIIYYFHEGWNWTGKEGEDSTLRFDAPLDENMNPRASTFSLIKSVGQSLKGRLGQQLQKSEAVRAPVMIAQDSFAQYSGSDSEHATEIASTDAAGLFGLLREAGYYPHLNFLDAIEQSALGRYGVVFWQYPGYTTEHARAKLEAYVKDGGTLIIVGEPRESWLAELGLTGRVEYLAKSYARDWNTDLYAGLVDHDDRLAHVQGLLQARGVAPVVRLSGLPSQSRVHVWLRKVSTREYVLFAENFASSAVEADVSFNVPAFKDDKRSVCLESFDDSSPTLTPCAQGKTHLRIRANGVDVWTLRLRD